jgi:hypothetical protein
MRSSMSLIDAELKVIAGHGRLLACRHLGRSEVPTLSQPKIFCRRSRCAAAGAGEYAV